MDFFFSDKVTNFHPFIATLLPNEQQIPLKPYTNNSQYALPIKILKMQHRRKLLCTFIPLTFCQILQHFPE